MNPKTTISRRLVLLVPLVLVNAVAVWGQAGWAYNHITDPSWDPRFRWALAFGFAAAVESIGVYLAWEAHSALMAGQSAGMLRGGSYAVGVLVGLLNYAHFAGDSYTPNPQAITFGLLSAISPWLWAIRSRSMNRDRLDELDMVDERGLKLSTSRKFWHPIRSIRVISWAAWAGVTKPAEAVARWEAENGIKAGVIPAASVAVPDAPAASKATRTASEIASVSPLPSTLPEAPVSPAIPTLTGEIVPAQDGKRPQPSIAALKAAARNLKASDPTLTAAQIGALLGRAESTVRGYLGSDTDAYPIVTPMAKSASKKASKNDADETFPLGFQPPSA
jgi:hypothetical protein